MTWDSIIDALGGTGAVADALVKDKSTVSGWRDRGIPARQWAAVARLASEQGKGDITLDVLAALAARKTEQLPDTCEARA